MHFRGTKVLVVVAFLTGCLSTADPLVEMTLERAIAQVDTRKPDQPVSIWLRMIMISIYRREESDFLH
jgi:DNA-directed RNA polymerase specialized sigma24 family protein